ncbi:MAG: phosphatase PAP2 family protein [Myxococcota bacterium]|nr:phosphatase PAP2 family protein [Myxococcota bacterium]
MGADAELFLFINQALSGPYATHFFSLITEFGNGLVLAVVVLPPMFFLSRRQFRRHALSMVIWVAVSGALVNITKIVVDRPRPPEFFAAQDIDVHAPLGSPSDRSFPSGHTQTAFGTATYLSCLYPALSPIFMAIAALVGVSRIALGVHFPVDVIVGGTVGAVASFIGFRLRNRRYSPSSGCPPARE